MALARLPRREVAHKRQEGPELTAGKREVGAVLPDATRIAAEPAHGVQVVAPVPAADDEGAEARAGEEPRRIVRMQERPDRHAGREPPRGRAEADQVVLALRHYLGTVDLARREAELGH